MAAPGQNPNISPQSVRPSGISSVIGNLLQTVSLQPDGSILDLIEDKNGNISVTLARDGSPKSPSRLITFSRQEVLKVLMM